MTDLNEAARVFSHYLATADAVAKTGGEVFADDLKALETRLISMVKSEGGYLDIGAVALSVHEVKMEGRVIGQYLKSVGDHVLHRRNHPHDEPRLSVSGWRNDLGVIAANAYLHRT
jgi:hypothetical protein